MKTTLAEAAAKTVELLKEKRLKLAAAESCTGGMLAQYITSVAGASEVFDCGVVAYANHIKEKLLDVKKETLESFGAVSAGTAAEMAEGVRLLANAGLGIAVSGIAGPDPDGTSKPVGLIYIALADKSGASVLELKNSFKDDIRRQNRESAVSAAFEMIISYLKGMER